MASDTDLDLVFKNAAGKKFNLKIEEPKAGIKKAEIDAAMQVVVENNIFNTSGGDIVEAVEGHLRTGTTDGAGKYLICVSNFTPNTYENFQIGVPMEGKVKEILSSDDIRFGGTGLLNSGIIKSKPEGFLDMGHSVRFTLPGMSTLYFSYTPSKPKAKKK